MSRLHGWSLVVAGGVAGVVSIVGGNVSSGSGGVCCCWSCCCRGRCLCPFFFPLAAGFLTARACWSVGWSSGSLSLYVSSTFTWFSPSPNLHKGFPVKLKPRKASTHIVGNSNMADISWLGQSVSRYDMIYHTVQHSDFIYHFVLTPFGFCNLTFLVRILIILLSHYYVIGYVSICRTFTIDDGEIELYKCSLTSSLIKQHLMWLVCNKWLLWSGVLLNEVVGPLVFNIKQWLLAIYYNLTSVSG